MKSRDQKVKEAIFRNAKWAAMSDKERLAYLNKNFPHGAKRQRAKIQARLQGVKS